MTDGMSLCISVGSEYVVSRHGEWSVTGIDEEHRSIAYCFPTILLGYDPEERRDKAHRKFQSRFTVLPLYELNSFVWRHSSRSASRHQTLKT